MGPTLAPELIAAYENSFFPGKTLPVYRIAFAVLVSLAVHAQAQQNSAQVEERVEGILKKMTLDEKLSYISGTGFPNP